MNNVSTVDSEYVLAASGACVIQVKKGVSFRAHVGLTKPASDTEIYFDVVEKDPSKRAAFQYSGFENVYIRCPPEDGAPPIVFTVDEV